MVFRISRCASGFTLLLSCLVGVWGQSASDAMPLEDRVLYRTLPDAPLFADSGISYRLSQIWDDKPLILAFTFTRCAGVCYPFAFSLREAVEIVGGLGDEYRVVVISFDPLDTPKTLQGMRRRLGIEDNKDWILATTTPQALEELVNATGFWYRRVEGTDQYDHPAMLVGVRKGRIVRLQVAPTLSNSMVRAVVRELKGDRVLSYPLPDPRIPFRCFGYDPKTGALRMDWGMLILIVPTIVGFSLASLLFYTTRRISAKGGV